MNPLRHNLIPLAGLLPQLLLAVAAGGSAPATPTACREPCALAAQDSRGTASGEFCALRLTVVDKEGQPGGAALVELVDKDGRVVFRDRTRDGLLDICDFDFGVYSLRIGSNECFPTTISNILLDLGVQDRLKVILNGCGQGHYVRAGGCKAYFRVASPDGKALAGVEVVPPISSRAKKTDSYGRVSFYTSSAKTVPFTFSVTGYQDQGVEVSCKDVETIERKVVMVPVPQE